MLSTIIFIIIITVLAVIIAGLIAYDRGFDNGLKAGRDIFDRVLDHSLLRFDNADLTKPPSMDGLE